MNYFFFLDTNEKDLIPSVEIFNRPPAKRLSSDKLKSKNVIAFYSDKKFWNYHIVSELKPNSSLLIKKTLDRSSFEKAIFLERFSLAFSSANFSIWASYSKPKTFFACFAIGIEKFPMPQKKSITQSLESS